MSHDTLDRDEQLESRLRTTLRAQAATVHDGPLWPHEAAGPHTTSRATSRPNWFAAAAAIVLILALAGGFAIWRGRSDGSNPAAHPNTEQVPLPSAWRSALRGAPLRIDGRPAQVEALTPAGDAVAAARDASGRLTLQLVRPDGERRMLYRVPRGDEPSQVAAEGHWLVFAVDPKAVVMPGSGAASAASDTGTRMFAVDLRSTAHPAVRSLADGAVPRNYVVNDGPALLDGVAYFTVVPAAEEAKARQQAGRGPITVQSGQPEPVSYPVHGKVVARTLSTWRHHVVGSAPSFDTADDPRGVFWPGGRQSATDVPDGVVPFSTTMKPARRDAHRNGSLWTWDDSFGGATIGWTDGNEIRRWTTDIAKRSGADLTTVLGVAGPYVFLTGANGVDPHLYVLDTRTGAYADTGTQTFTVLAGGSRVAAGSAAPFDVDDLPGLQR